MTSEKTYLSCDGVRHIVTGSHWWNMATGRVSGEPREGYSTLTIFACEPTIGHAYPNPVFQENCVATCIRCIGHLAMLRPC